MADPDYFGDTYSDPSLRRRGGAAVDDVEEARHIGRSRAYISQGFLPPARDSLGAGADYFNAPTAPRTRRPAPAGPLDNPVYKDLHAKREVLTQTEALYHKQLEDFDKGEGAVLRPERDPATGRELRQGAAQAHVQSLVDKSQGDATTGMVPKEVRDAEKNLRLLQEKRQRIADEASRVSQARQSFDQDVYMPARSAMLGGDGSAAPAAAAVPTPASPVQDFMQRDGGPAIRIPQGSIYDPAAPPGPKSGAGEPTPTPAAPKVEAAPKAPAPQDSGSDSLERIKQRHDEYQATLDAGGDNLRQDVRDRLKAQVSILNSKFQQGTMEQADQINSLFAGHITGKGAVGAPVDPKAAQAYFDKYAALGDIYARHQGAVIDAANKPALQIPHLKDNASDSELMAATKGAVDGLSDVASGLTSPSNAVLIGSLGVLGRAAKIGYAPARAILIAAQAEFTKQMAEGTYEGGKQFIQDIHDPNVSLRKAAGDATKTIASAVFTAGTAHGMVGEIRGPAGDPAVGDQPSRPGGGAKPPGDIGTPTPPPAPRPPTDTSVPLDDELGSRISALRKKATDAEAPPPPEPPGTLDHRAAGYDTRESFDQDYHAKGQHDVFETADEFLRRVYCSKLGRGNFSIA